MDAKEQEFLERLRGMFQVEAEEHLRALAAGLIELEKATEPKVLAGVVESVFREAHSLKGAARSVNLRNIEVICQPLEGAFASLKRQEVSVSDELLDLFHMALDCLTQLISTQDVTPDPAMRSHIKDLVGRLEEVGPEPASSAEGQHSLTEAREPTASEPTVLHSARPEPTAVGSAQPERAVLHSAPPEPTALHSATPEPTILRPAPAEPSIPASPKNAPSSIPPGEAKPALAATVRIPVTKLDPLLFQAEEMIQAKLAGEQRKVDLQEVQQTLAAWHAESSKRTAGKLNLRGEREDALVDRLDMLVDQMTSVCQAFDRDQRALRHMVDDHLEAVKQALMLPVSTLVEVFPKLIRDLARDQGKEVQLVITGTDLEIDKRILDELKDPLIHILRNSIDHGIEMPDERVRGQKPRGGTLTLAFNAKDSRQVEILISDDGKGIDLERVRRSAIRAGLITAEEAEKLEPEEAAQLIFQSGISTTEIITDISGRGLGLAIVREKAEKLGGKVIVDPQAKAGTTFRLRLPLTLATFRGVLVSVAEQLYVVPTDHIERALRVAQDEVMTVENREVVRVEGEVLSLVALADILGISAPSSAETGGQGKGAAGTADYLRVLVIAAAEQRIAVRVDEVLAEKEVLVKGLGSQLSRVRNIAGATVLGQGKVVPVLNVTDLMKSATRPESVTMAVHTNEENSVAPGRILVAEDSITSRTLLKSILESNGYNVTTAVDGADAFAQLRSGEFDLVVSDVDMPRMSGFELTTKIKGDEKFDEIPVVLVTSLESRADRERGVEVGANAYIIKSSFDQGNLLDVIHRLL